MQPVIEPQFLDLSERFVKAFEMLEESKQESVRRLGARWVSLAQAEAPARSGAFASGIEYQPFREQATFGFRGYSPQPLGNWIKFGTKPHPIAPRNAPALKFYWRKTGLFTIVPKGGGFKTHRVGRTLYIGKGRVDHPGTQPNPYHIRAYEMFIPEVREEAKRLGRDFVITLARGTSGRPA